MTNMKMRTRRLVMERWQALNANGDLGMSTAEYAVGTIAAVAFAAVLIAVVKSPAVYSALSGIISSALSTR